MAEAVMTRTAALAEWAHGLRFEDLPEDVIVATRLRILDVIGLIMAGRETQLGRAARAAAVALSPPGPCRIIGCGDRVGVTSAALANGALSQALQYDETHIESIVHMSSPIIGAALAIGDWQTVSGRNLITAIAIGNEIACRIGCVAPGAFHKRGLHPTGLFTTFGATYLAGRLLALDPAEMTHAAGAAGSFAAGLLQCWVDGSETQFLHPGWSAQAGIAAAVLAREGATGPAEVLEGRFGLFASHLQDTAIPRDFGRVDAGLGTHWESRASSFKPYPVAHVIHPYIDALLRLAGRHATTADDIAWIDCPVPEYIVPLVCEPAAEKIAPSSAFRGRVSLQYTLAEALARGRLGRDAYGDRALRDPAILALAARVRYHVDPGFPGPGRFKGEVSVTLRNGRILTEVEAYNRGSLQNPMPVEDLRAKFDDNAGAILDRAGRDRLAEAINRLDQAPDVRTVIDLAVPAR